jgi:SAM-dependent methyltransferase
MPSEFDAYADSYKEIINRGAAITGESFEYFIGVRVDLVLRDLERLGERVSHPRILDFGCGIGETARILREKLPGAIVHGVDPSEESLATARALDVPGATFYLIDGVRLPFESGSFDLVYSNGTFHHIDRSSHLTALARGGAGASPRRPRLRLREQSAEPSHGPQHEAQSLRREREDALSVVPPADDASGRPRDGGSPLLCVLPEAAQAHSLHRALSPPSPAGGAILRARNEGMSPLPAELGTLGTRK